MKNFFSVHADHKNLTTMGDSNKNILLTGGAGYIGIHCIVSLVKSGYTPIIADNMYNATAGVY